MGAHLLKRQETHTDEVAAWQVQSAEQEEAFLTNCEEKERQIFEKEKSIKQLQELLERRAAELTAHMATVTHEHEVAAEQVQAAASKRDVDALVERDRLEEERAAMALELSERQQQILAMVAVAEDRMSAAEVALLAADAQQAGAATAAAALKEQQESTLEMALVQQADAAAAAAALKEQQKTTLNLHRQTRAVEAEIAQIAGHREQFVSQMGGMQAVHSDLEKQRLELARQQQLLVSMEYAQTEAQTQVKDEAAAAAILLASAQTEQSRAAAKLEAAAKVEANARADADALITASRLQGVAAAERLVEAANVEAAAMVGAAARDYHLAERGLRARQRHQDGRDRGPSPSSRSNGLVFERKSPRVDRAQAAAVGNRSSDSPTGDSRRPVSDQMTLADHEPGTPSESSNEMEQEDQNGALAQLGAKARQQQIFAGLSSSNGSPAELGAAGRGTASEGGSGGGGTDASIAIENVTLSLQRRMALLAAQLAAQLEETPGG